MCTGMPPLSPAALAEVASAITAALPGAVVPLPQGMPLAQAPQVRRRRSGSCEGCGASMTAEPVCSYCGRLA